MQLSVIIVNYKVPCFTEQCLYSVLEAVKNIEAEIIVVDNNSADGSMEYLKPRFRSVTFLELPENLGFARANNKALAIAAGAFILFLNPDTIITANSINSSIQFLKQNGNAGAVGVQMIDGSGNFLPESKRAFPSPLTSFYKLTGLSALLPKSKIFNRYALGHLDKDEVQESPVLPGAFFMSRKSLLQQLKGFDESFFMYGEDIDLSYRIEKAGYRNYYLGNTAIVHFKGESTQRGSLNYTRQFYTAMLIFVQKHYSGRKAIGLQFFLRMAIFFRAMVAFLCKPVWYIQQQFSRPAAKIEKKICITGNAPATQKAREILTKYYLAAKPVDISAINALEKITANTIIFCLGDLACQQAIRYMEHHKNEYLFLWHHKNSDSIVGSPDKNSKGEFYTI